ncbi:hypothetical protein JCGZ_16225 [Jatropha curcas]|uniref:Uncharacterized protein n=1 Tax=Jatropha curcas TaxID=180498 RepID=A0A067KFR6_JATCU|nr:hypothetical protein JCGZ_16225 [Jatropha curcas]
MHMHSNRLSREVHRYEEGGNDANYVNVLVIFQEQNSGGCVTRKSKKPSVSPNVRCRSLALKALVSELIEEQKEWVIELDFGELLKLPKLILNRKLCYWLCEKFNSEKVYLEVPRNVTVRILPNYVGWVLKIPSVETASVDIKKDYKKVKCIIDDYNGCKVVVEAEVLRKIRLSSSKDEF